MSYGSEHIGRIERINLVMPSGERDTPISRFQQAILDRCSRYGLDTTSPLVADVISHAQDFLAMPGGYADWILEEGLDPHKYISQTASTLTVLSRKPTEPRLISIPDILEHFCVDYRLNLRWITYGANGFQTNAFIPRNKTSRTTKSIRVIVQGLPFDDWDCFQDAARLMSEITTLSPRVIESRLARARKSFEIRREKLRSWTIDDLTADGA